MGSRIGFGGGTPLRRISEADAVLDVSGGDSFSDIYGMRRFQTVALPKLMTLNQRRPLILLPQTYGPFAAGGARRTAQRIVRGAAQCWARDEHSFGVLRDLLGDAFDPGRHRCGVDMAFGLRPLEAGGKIPEELHKMLGAEGDGPLVGFNVSGLIYHNPAGARERYRFRAEYGAVVTAFLERVLGAGARVVLVPHVLTPAGHYESDPGACDAVFGALAERWAGRVAVSPPTLDQSEVKWLIARCDWFCGTRMHSTIAGLSSGVPTATIAYSDKAKGVFESCGQGGHVVDPRVLETEEVVERLWASFEGREAARVSLGEHLPGVLAKAEGQMDAIAEQILSGAGER